MFHELDPELKQRLVESNRFPFSSYAVEAVYHILLMRDALENANSHGNPEDFVWKYRIGFTSYTPDCGFHADLTTFIQKGLYIPPKWGTKGNFFDADRRNAFGTYIWNPRKYTPEIHELGKMAQDVCHPWTVSDFSDGQKLHKGLVFGQMMWCGEIASYKKFEEPKLDQTIRQLSKDLVAYYESFIGTIDPMVRAPFDSYWVS